MKIAIVGAGINGLYLAWKLSKAGHDVTVFERKEKIGKEACSGLFSERILGFIPQSRKLVQNEINFVLVNFPKRTLKIKFRKKFFVMSHAELDRLVSKLAEEAGAKIILGKAVDSWPQGFDRIIGCDGYNSFVRRELEAKKTQGLKKLTFRATIQGFLNKKDQSSFVETWPVASGFIWKIPRGKEIEYGIIAKPSLAKGLGDEDKSSSSPLTIARVFEEFLNKNNLKLQRIQGSVVPQGFSLPKNNVITLCGDAAGLTKPWSGGGVIWGLISDEILLKNFPDFIEYRNAVKKFFLPRIILSQVATKMVYLFGFHLPWFLPKNLKIESDFLI